MSLPSTSNAAALLRRMAFSRPASALLIIVLFWFAAAAGFAGFAGKWGLRETDQDSYRFGAAAMLDSTAARPFVYRQLGPMLANLAARLTPAGVKNFVVARLDPATTFSRLTQLKTPELQFKAIVILYLSFLALFLNLFVLRQIALDAGSGRLPAIIGPMTLALAMPYLQTVGGYFYDDIEFLFLSVAFLLAARGQALLLLALIVPANLNKESFVFYLPTLYPLLRLGLSKLKARVLLIVAVCLSGVVDVLVRREFASAAGGTVEFHLRDNIITYLKSWAYREWDLTYGLVGPRGFFVGTAVVVAIVVIRGLGTCPLAIKRHLACAAIINLPLVLLFGSPGEIRNLGFLFVGFSVLMALAINATLKPQETPARSLHWKDGV
jgi:hypothetical protein